MNSPVLAKPMEVREKDLIDRIAEALPAEVRAGYYRELRHCRSLPENDEMLRILRAMQFLVLLIHEAPSRLASERSQLQQDLASCRAAMLAIEKRLETLPQSVASGIAPEKVAARVNESLRQQFAETTIPETGRALATLASQMKKSVADFSEAARAISGTRHSAASEAREAIQSIQSAIQSAARSSQDANTELSRTLLRLNWMTIGFGAIALYLLGVLTVFAWFR